MKKLLTIAAVLLSIAAISYAAAIYPFEFTFTGKWQPAINPLLIEPNGFQDIQNLRRDGNRLKGVSGHSKINTATWDDNAPGYEGRSYVKNGFHYKKNSPAESHVLIYAESASSGSNGSIFYNETAIGSTGNFAQDTLYDNTNTTGMLPARFSDAPQEDLIISTDEKTLVWGGNETFIISLISSSAADTPTNWRDYSEQVTNNSDDSDQLALIGGGVDSYTVLMLHNDGSDGGTTFIDDSDSSHTVTANGDAEKDTDQKKFGTASGYFDGFGDYLNSADSADWNLGSSEFTIDCWIRFKTSVPQAGRAFFQQYDDASHYYYLLSYYTGGSYYIGFQVYDSDLIVNINSTWSPIADTWYHIAIIRGWGGVTNDWAITVNGAAVATGRDDSSMPDLTGGFEIARTGTGNYFSGWIDEFRLTKGLARWTSNFEVPTRPYSDRNSYFFIGSTKQLQGVKLYIENGNPVTSPTLTAKEWQGSSWVSLSITDKTNGLASTNTVTWTNTEQGEVKYIQGLSLYWYQFYLDSGDATISYITADAPVQTLKNIWDAAFVDVATFKKYDGSKYVDYTDEVQDETTSSVAVLNSLVASTNYILLGFTEPMQGFKILLPAGKENSTAFTTLNVQYWNGDSFRDVGGLFDGTEAGGISFAQKGVISFQQLNAGIEFEKSYSDEYPLYYYKLVFDEALDVEVEVYNVLGIPAPQKINSYKFSILFQNRLFLFNEIYGEKNKAIYSSDNTSYIFNGEDSGQLYFGDAKPIVTAAQLYNVFRTTGFYQLIVFKENETWRLFGDGPDNWEIQQISFNIGAVAPLSVAVCDAINIEEGINRQVIIWASTDGFYMCDGATVQKISSDIDNYFDPNDSDYISASYIDNIYGWYDPKLQSYKATVSWASTQVELEYSLKYQSWTRLYRENGSGNNPLKVGFQVHDTDGKAYTYGATEEGLLFRLENGLTWNGTGISEYVWTKDMLFDREKQLLRHSFVKYLRTMFKKKAASDDSVTITHYCDGVETTHGSNGQYVPRPFWPSEDNFDTQSAYLGPCLYHSFKYSTTSDSVANGMELLGVGIYFEPKEAIEDVQTPISFLERITEDGEERLLTDGTVRNLE